MRIRVHRLLAGICFLSFQLLSPPLGLCQETVSATIRGRVTEFGTGAPIADAEVTIHGSSRGEFAVAATTDADGAFILKIDKPGGYVVEAVASGYVPRSFLAGGPLFIQISARTKELRADTVLYRPSSIEGLLIDDAANKPLASLSVRALAATYHLGDLTLLPSGQQTTTDNKGKFTLTGLAPGMYALEIMSLPAETIGTQRKTASPAPTYGRLFWPLGSESDASMMLRLGAGETQSLGILSIASTRRPKARLLIGACPGSGMLIVSLSQRFGSTVFRRAVSQVPCSSGETAISGLSAGVYELSALYVDPKSGGKYFFSREVQPGNQNIVESIGLQKEQNVSGKVVLGDTSASEILTHIHLTAKPVIGLPYSKEGQGTAVAADGSFSLPLLNRHAYKLQVEGIAPPYYVKKIWYAGSPLDTDTFSPLLTAQNQTMEIDIGVDGAAITGTVSDSGKPLSNVSVLIVPSLSLQSTLYPSFFLARTDDDGRFSQRGLPPAKYRIAAISDEAWQRMQQSSELLQTMSSAEECEAPSGSSVSVSLPSPLPR